MTDEIKNILDLLNKAEFLSDKLQGIGHDNEALLWEQTDNLILLRRELVSAMQITINIKPNFQNETDSDTHVSFSEIYGKLIGGENSLLQDSKEKQIKIMEMGIVEWFDQLDHFVLSLVFLIRNFLAKNIEPWRMTRQEFVSVYSSLINYARILGGIANKNENLARAITRNGRKRIFESVPSGMRNIFDNDFIFNRDIDKVLESAHRHQVGEALSQNLNVPLEVLQSYPEFLMLNRHRKISEEYRSLIDGLIESTIMRNFAKIESNSIMNMRVDPERLITSFKSLFSSLNRVLIIEEEKRVILFKDKQKNQEKDYEIIYVFPLTNSLVQSPWDSFFEFERGSNYPVVKVEQMAVVTYDHDKSFEYEKEYQRYVILQKGKIIQR